MQVYAIVCTVSPGFLPEQPLGCPCNMYCGGCCVHGMACTVVPDVTIVSARLQGMPALQHAAYHQNADLVELLLLLGADVHATYNYQVGNIYLSTCSSTITMSAGSDMLCL